MEREALLASDRINARNKDRSMWFETESDSQSVDLEAPASVHDSGYTITNAYIITFDYYREKDKNIYN